MLNTDFTPQSRALLRIAASAAFITHGTSKVLGWPAGGFAPEAWDPAWIAGLIEMVGGALLLIGLFSRPVAFVMSGTIAIAYWWIHAANGMFPATNGGAAALLYCFVFLHIAVAGPGEWSLDSLIRRRPVTT